MVINLVPALEATNWRLTYFLAGTDEFMKWLDVLSEGKGTRVEPYLCLNFGTGTLDEALAWVEYCNGTKNTYYANLRRKNGRAEPYAVKYWALGNEVRRLSLPNP